jgi:hypothetical protein
MTSQWRDAMLACVLVIGGAATPACSRDDHRCSESNATGTPVDPRLMAFLSRARAAHHLADLKEDGEPAAAVVALVSIVDGPIPGRVGAPAAEAREVIADTQARIAELQSRLRQFDAALGRIDTALGWVPEVSYFRGHLFETRGLVEQRRGDDLARLGRASEAQAAKSRALIAFEQAMQIQADVIRQTPPDRSVPTPSTMVSPNDSSVPVLPKQSTTPGADR